MSIHKSLKIGDSLARRRSVLKREERVAKMIADATLKDDASVFGLPKLRIFVKVAKKKKKAKDVEGEAGAEGAAAAAPPAADAAAKKKG